MDLKSTQLKDTYGNLLTIGETEGSPTSGTLQNGDGEDISILTIGNSTSTNHRLILQDSTTSARILITSGDFYIDGDIDGGNNRDIVFTVDGGDESMRLESNGDISFRDTSANEAFYWDASTARLGIGTTSPSRILHTSGDIVRFDNAGTSAILLLDTTNNEGFRIVTNKDSGAFSIEDMGTATSGSGTERMRIDSSGNVGINNTIPSSFLPNGRELVLGNGSASHGMTIFSDSAGTGNLFFADGTTGDEAYRGFLRYAHSSDNMEFYTAGANLRMTIDSSGNVLVGQDSTSLPGIGNTTAGASVTATGRFCASVNSNYSGSFNRNTTDGTLVVFYKDGVSVGSISTNANSLPSDVNFKKDIDDLTLGLDFVSTLNPKSYRYKINDDDSPKMFGLIAQEIEQSLSEFGVQQNEVAMLQKIDKNTDADSEYALDYVKLVPILVNAIKELKAEIEQLKAQ